MEFGIYNSGNYELPLSVILTYIASAFIFVGYIIYAKYYDYHWTADFASGFVATSYTAAAVLI